MMQNKRLLQQVLEDPRTTRRDFMVGALALGLTSTVASGLWNDAQAAIPMKGGHLKAGLNDSNTADSLDSRTWTATTMISIGRAFRDSLVEVGQDDMAAPALAESWESSDDAKTWRFKLRSGVTFSNGKSLTTEDVIGSINLHRGEASTSGAKGVFSGIADVTADGKDVVVVTLTEANADLPYLMTDYHLNIVPVVDGKAEVQSRHGTGCYVLKEFEPGVRAALELNANRWQQDFGYVDSCELTTILDDTARQGALMSGDVHVINRPALKTIHLLERVPHARIVAVPSNLAFTHAMRMDTAPFDNPDFRQALKHALPRQEFVDKVLYGYGTIGNDQPIGPKMRSYDPSIQNEYDLDKARALIKKAGLEGTQFKMHTSDAAYGGALDAAQLFADSFRQIGVQMEVVREPVDGYWNDVWLKKPFCSVYWGARPVEDMILSIAYLSDAPWNDTVLKDERVDQLVKAARGELDPDKRNQMYVDVQEMISKNGGTLLPAFGQDVAAVNNAVGIGEKIGGGWEMDGGHFIKRWWLNG